MKEINELENAEEILKLPNSWEERGIEKGIKGVALELIKKGSSVEFIEEVTHLDRIEIENIKRKISE